MRIRTAQVFLTALLAIAGLLGAESADAGTKCRNAGPSQNQLSVGSQVDGRLLTICANQLTVKTTSTSKQTKQSKAQPRPLTRRQSQNINPTGQVVVQSVQVANHTQLVFRPVAPKLRKSTDSKLHPGDAIQFSVSEQTRFGFSYMQGRKLGVKFVPISFRITFSDGQKLARADFQSNRFGRAFEKVGHYRASAVVTYAPYYRWLKSGEWVNRKNAKWIRDPGTISLLSNVVSVTVIDSVPGQNSGAIPVLVSLGRL